MTAGGSASPGPADHAAVPAAVFDVRGRVVLVTGGASGLGLAIARVLAECGARVVMADRDEVRPRRPVTCRTSRAPSSMWPTPRPWTRWSRRG
ncbi:MAG: SDR family NAD(P)-dependent oxidoreductase [Streptosporangiaceae bacterium]